MKTLAESAITSKEQLTVPLVVRRLLGVKAGDSLVWHMDDQGHVIVEAGRPHTLEDVRAAVAAATHPAPPAAKRVTVAAMKAGIGTAMKRKHARR